MAQVDTNRRTAFPDKLARQIQDQFMAFSKTDMSGFTYEKHKSEFYGAKTDLSIYDDTGKLCLMGRDFGSRTFFWQP